MLILGTTLNRTARNAVNHDTFHRVGLRLPTVHDVDNILFRNRVILQNVLSDLLDARLETFHFVGVAEHANDVPTRHDAQFRIERLDDLQMAVAHAVEHHGVDVLKNNMLFCQNRSF